MDVPKVSVVMSVYNDQRFLGAAIDSVLGQTYQDFEFVIVNDGSTDDTAAILHSYRDPRLVLLENDFNLGLTRSLNRGLAVARGEYIARQDSNDLSAPERLALQVDFLDHRPEVGLLSNAYAFIAIDGHEIGRVQLPTDDGVIRQRIEQENVFCGASTMFRRRCVEVVGPFRPQFRLAQDYDQWLRIVEHFEVGNLPQVLYHVRFVPDSLSLGQVKRQLSFDRLARESAAARRRGDCDVIPFDPDKPVDPPIPEPERCAARYLNLTPVLFLASDEDNARRCIVEAISAQSELLAEPQAFANWLQAQANVIYRSTGSFQDGVRFIAMVCDVWPVERKQSMSQRKVEAQFCIDAAFAANRRGDSAQARAAALTGIARNPQWLRNRGVLVVLSKSLF